MKQIILSNGNMSKVDDEDFEMLNRYKWREWNGKNGLTSYAICRTSSMNHIKMHRLIMRAENAQLIDHKDGDGLNNQKSNLRFCTVSENAKNKRARGISKYLGVCRPVRKQHRKKTNDYAYYVDKSWQATIKVGQKYLYLGRFKKETDAAKAYNTAAVIYHGEFARLNIIEYNGN